MGTVLVLPWWDYWILDGHFWGQGVPQGTSFGVDLWTLFLSALSIWRRVYKQWCSPAVPLPLGRCSSFDNQLPLLIV